MVVGFVMLQVDVPYWFCRYRVVLERTFVSASLPLLSYVGGIVGRVVRKAFPQLRS